MRFHYPEFDVIKRDTELYARLKRRIVTAFIGRENEAYEPHPDSSRVFRSNDSIWIFGPPDKISEFIREAA